MALSKKNRLSTALFNWVFSSRNKKHSPYFQIINKPSPTKRFGVVVGKKVFKKAVDRNKMRRRLYEIIRTKLPDTVPAGSYIVLTKPTAKNISKTELEHNLIRLFSEFE